MHRLFQTPRRPYRGRAWWPLALRGLWYLEPVLKLLVPLVAISFELLLDHGMEYRCAALRRAALCLPCMTPGFGAADSALCIIQDLQVPFLPKGHQIRRAVCAHAHEQLERECSPQIAHSINRKLHTNLYICMR